MNYYYFRVIHEIRCRRTYGLHFSIGNYTVSCQSMKVPICSGILLAYAWVIYFSSGFEHQITEILAFIGLNSSQNPLGLRFLKRSNVKVNTLLYCQCHQIKRRISTMKLWTKKIGIDGKLRGLLIHFSLAGLRIKSNAGRSRLSCHIGQFIIYFQLRPWGYSVDLLARRGKDCDQVLAPIFLRFPCS